METIKHTKTYEKQPSRSNREIRAICIHMKTEKKNPKFRRKNNFKSQRYRKRTKNQNNPEVRRRK